MNYQFFYYDNLRRRPQPVMKQSGFPAKSVTPLASATGLMYVLLIFAGVASLMSAMSFGKPHSEILNSGC